jgi:hypothetical protein
VADQPHRLEIEPPLAVCGRCRFATCLQGQWSVVEGRLRFDAEPDPLTRRGPSIDCCVECGAGFEAVVVEHGDSEGTDRELTAEELEAVLATAREEQRRVGA